MRKKIGNYVRKGMAVATAATVLATSVPMGNLVVRAEVQDDVILDEDEGYQEDEDEDEDENEEQGNRGNRKRQSANGNAGVNTPSDATPQATSSNAGVAVTNLMGARAGQKCGENAYWAFDEAKGTLTISGSGKMKDYSGFQDTPWKEKQSAIKAVVIEDGITHIGMSAFWECTNLSLVSFGADLKTIGESAFKGCTKLSSVSFGNSVEWIRKSVFSGCVNLTSVSFGTGLKTIDDFAFFNCNLNTITLGNAVESIGMSTFADNQNLTKVTIKAETVPYLSVGAFSNTAFVKKQTKGIVVPPGQGVEYRSAWSEYRSYIRESESGKCGDNLTWAYDEETKTLTISGSGAMWDYGEGLRPWNSYWLEIEKIVVESGVTSISNNIFNGHTGLKTVTFGGAVENIGVFAFEGCTSLETVTFKGNVGSMGTHLFNGCTNLKTVTFKGNVGSMGIYPFSGCTNLKTVAFEGNVGSIGASTFEGCTSLEMVTFKGDVESIGASALEGCISLETVTFEGDVGSIGASALKGCTSLEMVIFKGNVGSIGEEAFAEDTFLKIATFKGAVGSIGTFAFEGCTSLETVTFEGDVESLGDVAFFACTALKHLSLKGKVGSIGEAAFGSCIVLECVVLEGKVGSLGDGAFFACTALKYVVFEDDVDAIGTWAFAQCESLQSVSCGAKVPQIGYEVFVGSGFVNRRERGIIVPNESAAEYRRKWREWARYITEKDPVEEEGEIGVCVNGGVVYLPSDLPSYVQIGNWAQTADGSWTFTSFGKVCNLNSASHGGAGGSGGGAGSLAKGWVAAYNPYATGGQDSYDWFYFDANGVMVTSWFTDTDGNIYYLNPESDGRRGAMLVGWQWIDRDGDGVKEQYYFNEESDGTRGKMMR